MIDGKNTVLRADSDGSASDERFIILATLNNAHLMQADTANYDLVPSPP